MILAKRELTSGHITATTPVDPPRFFLRTGIRSCLYTNLALEDPYI